MVDALREAQRVLTQRGTMIDVRPVLQPVTVEVVTGGQSIWATELASFSAPPDIAAAEAAVKHALSSQWFSFEKSQPFEIEVYCDTAADFRQYAEKRALPDAEIPYESLETQRLNLMAADGQTTRVRCRRPWMLSVYRK